MQHWELVLDDQPVWVGPTGSAPSSVEFIAKVQLLVEKSRSPGVQEGWADNYIQRWTVQILRHAPGSEVAGLLSVLACAFWDCDPKKLFGLLQTRPRRVCGKVFKRGDMVWTCRTCAKDQTCVQCNDCYTNSNHTGHEVFFHRAGGNGGCCDCGDPEAWHVAGNCHLHGEHKKRRMGSMTATASGEELPSHSDDDGYGDILQSVPSELHRGLQLVGRTSTAFLLSYVTSCVRGYQHVHTHIGEIDDVCNSNPFVDSNHPADSMLDSSPSDEELSLYLHNDDVHTYDDVTVALGGIGMNETAATDLTKLVDQDGQSEVHKQCVSTATELLELKSHMDYFVNLCGLICSLAPTRLHQLETRLSALMEWFIALAKSHEGLQRIVSLILVVPLTQLPDIVCLQGRGFTRSASLFSTPSLNVLDEQEYLHHRFLPEFPVFLQHLVQAPGYGDIARQCLSDPPLQFRGMVEPFRALCPLLHTPGLRVPLAVLLLASPMLFKSIRQQLNSLIVIYQQDSIFKASFSQLLTCLYPSIHALKVRGVGPAGEEVFSTTVQIYTANGVVTTMSSDGIPFRVLNETSTTALGITPVLITKMLVDVARNALFDLGCTEDRSGDSFLEHSHVANRRLAHLFRDFEYVTENSLGNIRVLSGLRDSGTVDSWLSLCKLLQCLDSHTRKTDFHIEMENNMWCFAANLVLELESASTNLVTNALFPSKEIIESERQVSSIDISWAGASEGAGVSVDEKITRVGLSTASALAAMETLQQEAFSAAFSKSVDVLSEWYCSQLNNRVDLSDRIFVGPHDTLQLLGFSVAFQDKFLRNYNVSKKPVSLHTPLQRFASKLLLFAAYRGLDLTLALNNILVPVAALSLVDYSLRSIVFSIQANVGLWVRNGFAPVNLAYNYVRPPLCRILRDMDLLAIQAGMVRLGSEVVLSMAVDRFELGLNFGDTFSNSHGFFEPREFENHVYLTFISELVGLMARIIVALPPVLNNSRIDENKVGLAPELQRLLSVAVVNNILAGSTTLGALTQIRGLIGNAKACTEGMITSTCSIHATKRESADGLGAVVLELMPEATVYFDPQYLHLSDKKAFAAAENMRERIKRLQPPPASLYGADRYRPLLNPAMIPTPHEHFAPVRSTLTNPLFITFICRVLNICLDPVAKTAGAGAVGKALEGVIYILTLRCLLHDAGTLVGSITTVGDNVFDCLCRVYSEGYFDYDLLYQHGLTWLLCRISGPEGSLLHSKGLGELFKRQPSLSLSESAEDAAAAAGGGGGVGGSTAAIGDRDAAKKMAAAAQARARAAMASQTARFINHSSMFAEDDSDSDAEEDDIDTSNGSVYHDNVSLEASAPKCILCHERNGQPCGYLALISPSTVVSSCIAGGFKAEHPQLSRVFRVTSQSGLDIMANGQIVLHVPQGAHLLAAPEPNRYDTLLLVEAPARGYVSVYSPNQKSRSSIQTSARSRSDIKVNLVPLSRVMWNQHGPARGYITRCGHAMHINCYRTYFDSCQSEGPVSRMAPSFDLQRGEVHCPMCKSVSNTIIPHTPPAVARSLWGGEGAHNSQRLKGLTIITRQALAAISPVDSKPLSSAAISAYIHGLLERGPPSAPQVPLAIASRKFMEILGNLGRLPWLSELHTRPVDGVRAQTVVMKCVHGLWAAVGHTVLMMANVRRWVGWDSRERKEWFEDDEAAGSKKNSSAGDASGSVSKDSEDEPSPIAPQLLLLLRQLPEIICAYNGMDLSSHEEGVEFFEHAIVTPMKNLLSGHEIVDVLPSGSSTAVEEELCCIIDASDLTTLEAMRLLSTMPFESSPSSTLPDPRRHSLLLDLCSRRGVPPDELWAILRLPLLSQDLNAFAALMVATAKDIAAIPELFALLVWARICQIILEPRAPCNSDCSPTAKKDVASSSGVGTEQALLELEKILGVGQQPGLQHQQTSAGERGPGLRLAVLEGLGPLLELLALMWFSVQCAATGGDVSAMRTAAAAARAAAPSDAASFTSKSSDADRLAEIIDEQLREINCPPLVELLCGSTAPSLHRLARDWAFQYYSRIDRCMGRVRTNTRATGASTEDLQEGRYRIWIPERVPTDCLEAPEAEKGDLKPSSLGALCTPGGRGSWGLVGLDPEYYFVDEPPKDSSLDIPMLTSPLQRINKGMPLLGSLSGEANIAGVSGVLCKNVWPDLSHLGLSYRHKGQLAPLPKSYNELYHRCKFLYGERDDPVDGSATNTECFTVDEPAVCLVCGKVIMAGNRPHATDPSVTNPGECTLHARNCGLGSGLFFVLQKHAVLLIRNEKAAFWGKLSIYLDDRGEVGVDGGCRPLFLCESRHRLLQEMWLRGEVGREVARIRATSDKVIRDHFY